MVTDSANWKQYNEIKRLLERYGLLAFSSEEYERFNRELMENPGRFSSKIPVRLQGCPAELRLSAGRFRYIGTADYRVSQGKGNNSPPRKHKMDRLEIPPYGKQLFDLQKQGLRPVNSVYIFAGLRAWAKTAAFQISHPDTALCLPPWRHPHEFHWPVRDCEVLIVDTLASDQEYIDWMAEAAFRDGDGAGKIYFISQDFEFTKYDKELS